MNGFGDSYKKKKNKNTKLSKEQIINQAIKLHLRGNIREAIKYYQQIIKLGWNDPRVFANYGIILRNLGNLKEAEISFRKAIALNPNLVKAYYALSRIKYSDKNKIWQDLIFSENFLIKKSKKDQVSIYFTRANILHKEKKIQRKFKVPQMANKIKLAIRPSKPNDIIDKSIALIVESDKKMLIKKTVIAMDLS